MSNCPVCQMNYVPSQDVTCSTCSFDLSPYLPALGELPESYLAKEKSKLKWAQETWGKLQETNKGLQVQIDRMNNKIGEEDKKSSQAQLDLQGQLNKLRIENDELKNKNSTLNNIKSQHSQSADKTVSSKKDTSAEVKSTSSSEENNLLGGCGCLLLFIIFAWGTFSAASFVLHFFGK